MSVAVADVVLDDAHGGALRAETAVLVHVNMVACNTNDSGGATQFVTATHARATAGRMVDSNGGDRRIDTGRQWHIHHLTGESFIQ